MRLTPTRLPGTPGVSLGPRARMQANPPCLSHAAAVPIVTAARWRLGCRGDVPLRRTSARLPFDLLVMGGGVVTHDPGLGYLPVSVRSDSSVPVPGCSAP